MYKIAVLPCDGVGPEVVREGLKVLAAAAAKYGVEYETVEYDIGGDRYLSSIFTSGRGKGKSVWVAI